MRRSFRLVLGISAFLAIAGQEARAQYYPGYGRYGWGGWGGGSTVQGDIARGLGYYNVGVGVREREEAIAGSINTDTVMRWNQYLWQSQQEANRREYVRRNLREQRDSQSGERLYQQIRDKPTSADIASGDALNVVLDQVTDPRIHSSALRMATDTINGNAIGNIPFVSASEAVSLSLNELTAKEAWPAALVGEEFVPERDAYRQAIADALKEDEGEGRISAQTIDRLRGVLAQLRAKLEAMPPADRALLGEARNYIKTLYGLTRMLENPKIDKVLAELEKVSKTSLGSLLGFMHTYNLRFGRATNPEQRAVYEALYPMMAAHRDRVVKDAGLEDSSATRGKGHPTDFFQGMHLDHLGGDPPQGNGNTR